jgi:hypothetical protein
MQFITRQFQVSGFKFQAASFLKIAANRNSGAAASWQSAAYFGGNLNGGFLPKAATHLTAL